MENKTKNNTWIWKCKKKPAFTRESYGHCFNENTKLSRRIWKIPIFAANLTICNLQICKEWNSTIEKRKSTNCKGLMIWRTTHRNSPFWLAGDALERQPCATYRSKIQVIVDAIPVDKGVVKWILLNYLIWVLQIRSHICQLSVSFPHTRPRSGCTLSTPFFPHFPWKTQ